MHRSNRWPQSQKTSNVTIKNFAFVSSGVAAVPFVTPIVAGTMAVMDHNQRSSGPPMSTS